MKKRIFSLVLLAVMALSLTAQAASPRMLSGSPKLKISGTTATCSATVESGNTNDEIKLILTLWCGESIVDSWSETGVGSVTIKETCKVVVGNYYELVMMPVVNGEALEPVTVSAYS